MTAPLISNLPSPPQRGMVSSEFIASVNAYLTALGLLPAQINEFGDYVNGLSFGESEGSFLFTEIGSVDITTAINVFISAGYDTIGSGVGIYVDDALSNFSLATAHPRFCKADGSSPVRYWRLISDPISIKHFGAIGDGVADDTAALAAARAWLVSSSTKTTLVFPDGVYLYNASPNWAISNVTIEARGEVRLRYTGTDHAVIFDAGATAGLHCYNVRFRGNFIIESNALAKDGVFIRGCHHSQFEARVTSCGATYAGFRTNFAVCTELWPTVSSNEEGWYGGATPFNGIWLDKRTAGEYTAACILHNPVIEGVGGDGIVLYDASDLSSYSGTSEGNVGRGVVIWEASNRNTFYGIDIEACTGNGYVDAGDSNSLFNAVVDDPILINATAVNSRISGGDCDSITDNGYSTTLECLRYGLSSGALAGAPVKQTKRNVFNFATGKYIEDKAREDLEVYPLSVPHNTATTAFTFPATEYGMYHVTVHYGNIADAANYNCYALVYHDNGVARILSQVNAANMTITIAGAAVQITQTSGVTQATVYAKAVKM